MSDLLHDGMERVKVTQVSPGPPVAAADEGAVPLVHKAALQAPAAPLTIVKSGRGLDHRAAGVYIVGQYVAHGHRVGEGVVGTHDDRVIDQQLFQGRGLFAGVEIVHHRQVRVGLEHGLNLGGLASHDDQHRSPAAGQPDVGGRRVAPALARIQRATALPSIGLVAGGGLVARHDDG